MRSLRNIIAVLAVSLGLLALPSATEADNFEPIESEALEIRGNQIPGVATGCEEMDHSLLRLYFAYFLRFPDQGGFDYWQGNYSSGDWSLTRISQFFAGSPEFISLYGSLSDADFVTLIYQNVLFRNPDAGGLAHWTAELARGVRRGTVMLAFSESQEFVEGNDTVPATVKPLAGYGRWYPDGIVWVCGPGNQTYSINRDFQFVDLLVWNDSGFDQNVNISAFNAAGTSVFARQQSLADNFIAWEFGNESATSAVGWRSVKFTTANGVIGTMVLYDSPPPVARPGW